MKQIEKNNYKQFLNHYSNFHDCHIKEIDVVGTSKISIVFDVWTIEKSTNIDNKICEKKPVKLNMVFKNVSSFNENDPYIVNRIDYTYIDFYTIQNGKSLICFSLNAEDPDKDPYIYITCESIEYEEIG